MNYLFGDTDIAAQRLHVLAEVYAASTRAFLETAQLMPPRLVLDLGCGPGYTTHLLAEVFNGARVVGLDTSVPFIALANQTCTPSVSFSRHDVTAVPFPVEAGDLVYSRLLLAHLREPRRVLAAWATQLQPQGLLLMEEVEWIQTTSAVFTTYLDIVTAMLAQQSTNMYVGRELHELPDPALLRRRSSQVRRVPVLPAQAATMFFLNMQTWKQQPFIQTTYAAEQIRQLEEDLRLLTQATPTDIDIEWGMRQLMYERA